jgi:drug/metabolite transporter (DMT)-like permease
LLKAMNAASGSPPPDLAEDDGLSEIAARSAEPHAAYDIRDYAPLAICSLIWGSTWFAITFQLGLVPAAVSIAYRFGLAAALLFAWLALSGRPIRMTRAQHLATFAQGALTFGVNYLFIYLAEARLTSAVVAVIFAAMAFVNLVLFRLTLGIRASRRAWTGAALGVAGVAALFVGELQHAQLNARTLIGFGLGGASLIGASLGNLAARRAQLLHADLGANTAWGMAYGAGILALGAVAFGQPWRFEASVPYIGSLLYLAVFGSVAAFLLYFSLARRRGYVLASYISAVTPAIAMLISAVFEHAHWGPEALVGLALVMAGQVLLARAPRGV